MFLPIRATKPTPDRRNAGTIHGGCSPVDHNQTNGDGLTFWRKYLTDVALWTLATPLAFLVRFDFMFREGALPALVLLALVGLPLKAFAVHRARLHFQSWRTVTFRDVGHVLRAVVTVTAVMFVVGLVASTFLFLPRSVPLIEGAIATLLLFGVRSIWRYLHERPTAHLREGETVRRAVIVGAGEAGVMVAKEMIRHPEMGIQPVAYVDDAASKQGLAIAGITVEGTVAQLSAVLEARDCNEVIIAAPSAEGTFIRKVVDLVKASDRDVKYRVMPGVYELIRGDVSVSRLREVEVEDLLRRKPVDLDLASIAGYIDGETVLVTGAGGSIGSELVRQLAVFRPAKLLLLGRGENSIYDIDREFAAGHHGLATELIIGDVRDRNRLMQVFDAHRPTVVFHAAAHKHVPLMEANPGEAFQNNVCGTRNLVELALERGVKRFVNISTDKAVNPSSVMGLSKNFAEKVVRAAAQSAGPDQRLVSVRFGNVLGSRGSVVPFFKKQIHEGGPVTVTHPDMTRYFMTIPEATQLVLQAGGLAENGRTYILDMGEPVKIVDLAEDLIRLSGLEPHEDVEIVFTGVRPGEKIHEELMTEAEWEGSAGHAMIHVAKTEGAIGWAEMMETIRSLEERAWYGEPERMRQEMAFSASTDAVRDLGLGKVEV